eukprot:m.85016 g.85016  ORF g.85016 m.85016 type:complete len:475 (+) comp12768_c0_seq1:70-1494(+)
MEGHEGVGVGVGVDGEGSNDGAEVAVARSAEESIEAEVKDVAQAFGYLRVDSGEADVGTESVGAISSLELDEFRRQWKAELDHELGAKAEHPLDAGLSGPSSSFSHVPVPIHSLSAEAKEQQALEYHIKGTMLEDSGHHQEALVYYRRAARLVPDIEFAAHRLTVQAQEAQESRAKRERETSDTREREQFDLQQASDTSDSLTMEPIILTISPSPSTKTIADMPAEVLERICYFLVLPHLSLEPVLSIAQVCRAFAHVVKEQRLWYMIAQSTFPFNPPLMLHPWWSWRGLCLGRLRPLFHGVYVSKLTYFRRGEASLDQLYKPFHTVVYFRYLRLFVDGTVSTVISSDPPSQVVHQLKPGCLLPEYLEGTFTCTQDELNVFLQKDYAIPRRQQQRQRARFHPVPAVEHEPVLRKEADVTFRMRSHQHRTGTRLEWVAYTLTYFYQNSPPMTTELDLVSEGFRPYRFVPVEEYLS